MNRSILFNFYQAIIQSILSSSILVWYGAATQQDLYKLNSVVKYCEKIVNLPLPSLENIYFERLEKKTNLILKMSTILRGNILIFYRVGVVLDTLGAMLV